MTSIKFELPENYKRQLKVCAVQNDISLTKLVLECLYDKFPPQSDTPTNAKSRIDEISTTLAKFGANMTKEEREQLKAERKQLKKENFD